MSQKNDEDGAWEFILSATGGTLNMAQNWPGWAQILWLIPTASVFLFGVLIYLGLMLGWVIFCEILEVYVD